MLQAPVNYYQPPVQAQPSYNAVKIDIHNPKVMDACNPCQATYPSPYAMPTNSYYAYPQATAAPCYPQMPQINPCVPTLPQPVQVQPLPQPVPQVIQQPVQTVAQANSTATATATSTATTTNVPQAVVTPVAPQPVQTAANCPCCNQPVNNTQPVQPAVVPTPVPVVPVVPVVPAPVPQAPVQQVINNGIPAQQTIQQAPQPVQTTTGTASNATSTATATATTTANGTVKADANVTGTPTTQTTTVPPVQQMPANDVAVVLKGLQSNNMVEQSDALSKIGAIAENPQEVKKYLETSVLDAILNILNTDTTGLEPATQAQNDARTKLMNGQTLTEAEQNLAMTLAPQEFADRNKQHALYSLAILQKSPIPSHRK